MKNLLPLILLCFFLTNFSASAQTSKGSVGLVGSSDFYNFEFNPDLKTGGMYDGIFNYSLGLEGSYRFTDYFSGSLGLLGAKKGFEKEYFSNVVDPGNGETLRTTRLDIYYLDVPVLLDYDFYLNSEMSAFISGGVVPGFLIDDKEVSNYTTDTDRRTNFMNSNIDEFIMSAQVSFGLKLQVYDTKSISIEPYFRKYFSEISPDLMDKNPNVFGVQIGIYQHF